jgi:hypothetical protein
MCKHVDLIAVGFLLLAFAFAARLHESASLEIGRTHVVRAFRARPIIAAPPHVPRLPCLPHFPHVSTEPRA